MNAVMVGILVFFTGLFLGFFYFPLLWLTVRRLAESDRPMRLMAVSFLLRFGVAVTVFLLVMDGRVERLIMALAGFIVAREVCKRRWGEKGGKGDRRPASDQIYG